MWNLGLWYTQASQEKTREETWTIEFRRIGYELSARQARAILPSNPYDFCRRYLPGFFRRIYRYVRPFHGGLKTSKNPMPLSRRNFLKITGITAGAAAVAAIGVPLAVGEKEGVFDPNDSYWALEQPTANPPLLEDLDVDVAIIGGGYTGLSAAWHLAQKAPG